MLSVKKLTRKYKNGSDYVKAVDNITTHFNVGEFVFVLGASGSGKSTLLNVLCGLDTDIEGSVIVDGIDTKDFSKKDWAIYRNHYVGFVFQEYNLIGHLKLWENVALPLQFQGISKSDAKIRAIEELERVGLGKMVEKKPNHISGGQAQRVAIARALITNPKVIMADEPTGALDSELGDKIIDYLKEVSKERVVVIVTHDEDLAHKYASRIISLEDGKVKNDTGLNEENNMQSKTLDFKRPKMTLGMMFKFAKNNVFSRMFRSIATAAVVSIGYVAIMLLSFMIFGINNSITDTISSFVPEDMYNIYEVQSVDITEDKLAQINQLSEIDNARYDVSESLDFESPAGVDYSGILAPIPYDDALLLENATLLGELPQNGGEILISMSTAAQLYDQYSVTETDYEYFYNLLIGTTIDLTYKKVDEFDDFENVELHTYKIVGLIAPGSLNSSVGFFLPYEDVIEISNTVNESEVYKQSLIVYLNIEKEKDIDALKIQLRDDHDLVLDNIYQSVTSGIEDFMFTALKIFVGVASISLIVSGILIGLIIYTSILERIKEIGILTAIGARQDNLVGIFVIESGFIGVLSSIIAGVFALVLSRFINGLFNTFIEQPLSLLTGGAFEMTLLTPKLWIFGLVVAFSLLFSMLVGFIPSLHAARLNAVKALRRE
jgi:ABC-type lipoprotein export system ATPase subunit/ABC-type antimicrobial peptide transport system permease subunit